jgi:uncharacterized protein (DUF2252 family)
MLFAQRLQINQLKPFRVGWVRVEAHPTHSGIEIMTKKQEAASSINPEDRSSSSSAETGKVKHRTLAERVALGKVVRSNVPRGGHATWDPPADRPDPIGLLEAQAATRLPELVPIRYGRMLASPFAFYRGAAVIMASDLASMPNTGLRVQLCGDAHLANFGGFASPERELILDLNDFDETLPGPWEWDVKRLAASIEIACRERGFDDKTRRSLVLATVAEYHRAMHEFAELGNLDMWYLHLSPDAIQARFGTSVKHKAIKSLKANFAHAYQRDNLRAFEKLTHRVNGQLKIVANPPLVTPIEDLTDQYKPEELVETMRELVRKYRLSLQPDHRRLLESFRYVHIARKVVGVGSVGTRTWILLLLGRDESDPLFLQVKEAQASVLEPYLSKSIYAENGKRVVEGQWLMQAASDIFLGWERVPAGLDGKSHDFYIRQLWDWKISADVEVMEPGEMMVYGRMCGWTLARAHARTGDRVSVGAYLGKGAAFDKALAAFAAAYADQNERDYQALVEAVKDNRIEAETGI